MVNFKFLYTVRMVFDLLKLERNVTLMLWEEGFSGLFEASNVLIMSWLNQFF